MRRRNATGVANRLMSGSKQSRPPGKCSMAMIPLPPDFSEFLRLLNQREVKYLLVGGYAVGYHGYVRATADLDVWIRRDRENAARVVQVLEEFGFGVCELNSE